MLWVLAPSAIPVAVNLIYMGVARVKKRLRDMVLLPILITAVTLSLGYWLIPLWGINAPGVAWLCANTGVSLALIPRFVRFFRLSGAGTAFA